MPLESPAPGTPDSRAPVELVTPVDRYARSWMLPCRKQRFAVAIIPDGAILPHTLWASGRCGAGLLSEAPAKA
jgi:hypothetical protein